VVVVTGAVQLAELSLTVVVPSDAGAPLMSTAPVAVPPPVADAVLPSTTATAVNRA